jgi:hypothetical protein
MNRKITLLIIISLGSFCLCKGSDPQSRLNYTNYKYKFSIRFPDGWMNYGDFERIEIIDSKIDIPVVYFALPTRVHEWQSLNVSQGYSELFYVRIFTKEKWNLYKEKYEGTNEFRLSDKIFDEGQKFVYMIRFSNSVPVDLHFYVKETALIADSFRVLK